MTRAFVSRRLRSRRSHIHIEKDDGNRELRFDNKLRRVAAEPVATSSVGSPEDRRASSPIRAKRPGKQT